MPQPRSPQTRLVDNAGNSMMHLLASNGHQPMLGMLLGATAGQADGYESPNAATSDEESLWPAPASGNTPVARRAELDIDITNKEGMTPLCLAARNGHYSTVEMLLEQGALVNHVSRNGMTPLWLACRLTTCMPENSDQGTAGVQMSAAMMVDLMLRYGALPDEASFEGQTPLLAAAATGDTDIVKQLIAAGANVNHADRNGLTPLMRAAHSGHADVAAMLLNNGAKPDSHTGQLSALVFAAEGGHDAVVRLLIERGARTDRVDAYGSTALIGASAAGNASTVKLLIDKGANRMAKDRRGHDALYYAMKASHAAVVMALQESEPAPRDF
jgi:ankyrin repeat protein